MLVVGSDRVLARADAVVTLTTDIVLGAAPPERAGAASALSETSAELGGALGIAVMGSIVTAIYRGGFNGAVAEGIPADALEAARTTIGAAVTAAGELEGEHGIELLEISRLAFADAFGVAAWISALIAIAVALLATRIPRARAAAS